MSQLIKGLITPRNIVCCLKYSRENSNCILIILVDLTNMELEYTIKSQGI